mgnify:CR=1 FL=1
MSEKKFMTRRQILDTIKDLGRSQGLYSRIYEAIMSLKEADKEQYDSFMNHLVNQQFESPVDLVLFFEA